MSSVAERLQKVAEHASAMNEQVEGTMEAYRKEIDDLHKKIQALQSALLAKAAVSWETASDEQGSVKPKAFADLFTSDVVKLELGDRKFSVHRSILESIPFFAAKLDHWPDEPLQLPETSTELAFEMLLKRMYLGISLPAGDIALCAQIISLAKYWLLDDIALEMVAELLRSAKKEDIPLLESLAKSFDLPDLSAAVDKLRRSAMCSSEDLETMVRQALEGDVRAQKLGTTMLEGHPEATAVLRKKFESCDFFMWSEERKGINPPKTVHVVRVCSAFWWFWLEVKRVKLLETDLPLISKNLISKLNQRSGYRMNQLCLELPSLNRDTTPTTIITALSLTGGVAQIPTACLDILDAASAHLRTRHLLPAQLKEVFTSMPERLVEKSRLDEAFAKMITGLPLATSIEILQLMQGRISSVGSMTAEALLEVGTGLR